MTAIPITPTLVGGRIVIVKNGTDQIAVAHDVAAASYHTELTATSVYELAAGDWIEAHVGQDSGGPLQALGYPTLMSPECSISRQA